MRPSFVVLDAPRFDGALRIGQVHERALVEAFIAESAIEAFDVTVLARLAWANEVERDAAVVRPLVERLSRELRAIFADDGAGSGVMRARSSSSWITRGAGSEPPEVSSGHAREIIDDAEHTDHTPITERTIDEAMCGRR
ncbi:MAG TPA: hypothetical protein VN706_15280 [Gemmatimonadaceae bacterium]|nr:hypothetical protein [Gemmatimonadaceae bacterium]